MSEIDIRLAAVCDIELLIEVGDQLFDFPVQEKYAHAFFSEDHNMMAIACEARLLENHLQTRVVGFASGFIYGHPDKSPILFVNEVGVLESHQNRKMGRALVRCLLEEAKRNGILEAWVATESTNGSARRAFTAAGGKEHEVPITLINYHL